MIIMKLSDLNSNESINLVQFLFNSKVSNLIDYFILFYQDYFSYY